MGPKIKTQENPKGCQQNPKKSLGLPTKLNKIPGPKKININSQKNATLNFQALKISRKQNKFGCKHRTKHHHYESTTTTIQIVLNTQKISLLNQATQKIPAKFSYLKKWWKQKFQTQNP